MLPAQVRAFTVAEVANPSAHKQVASGKYHALNDHFQCLSSLRRLPLPTCFNLYYDVILPRTKRDKSIQSAKFTFQGGAQRYRNKAPVSTDVNQAGYWRVWGFHLPGFLPNQAGHLL